MTAVSALASQRMRFWRSRRPVFALMGEYSSGKSALLNALLGRQVLPTKVTATDLPAIWMTYGKGLQLQAMSYDGKLHKLTMEELTLGQPMQYLAIRVECDAEILERCDIIDTPGISDPRMSTQIVEEIAGHTDFVVWCSPANQAWRQTERAFWSALPNALRQHSIMVLTRADKMQNANDMNKVLRRCVSEVGGLFSDVLPLATPQLMAARIESDTGSAGALLESSGAAALISRLDVSIAAAIAACAEREDLPDPDPVQKSAAKSTGRKPQSQAEKPSKSSLLDKIASDLTKLKADAADFSNNDRTIATISHLSSTVREDKGLSDEHRKVLVRALTIQPGSRVNVNLIAEQVENEVKDFLEGGWHEIGTRA